MGITIRCFGQGTRRYSKHCVALDTAPNVRIVFDPGLLVVFNYLGWDGSEGRRCFGTVQPKGLTMVRGVVRGVDSGVSIDPKAHWGWTQRLDGEAEQDS